VGPTETVVKLQENVKKYT